MRSRYKSLRLRSVNLGSVNLGSVNLGSVSLGSVNLALLSCYFFPVWGRDAVRALISPFNGLENPAHATAALYFRRLFDVGFNNLTVTSHVIAGIKLVMVAAFVAYLIEFARSWATGRAADRETTDVVLILAVVGIIMSALPALAAGEAALIRLTATQMLMVAGAITVIVVERHVAPEPVASRVMTAANERAAMRLALPVGVLAAEPPPPQAAAALARIPEARLRQALDRY
jgi:hypothetical protein